MNPCDVELLELSKKSLDVKNPIFGEVGTWCGRSALMMGKWLLRRDGDFYAIDHFRGSMNDPKDQKTANRIMVRDIYFRNISLMPNIHTLAMTSIDAARIFKDEMFDLFFIDGDHRYAAVQADIEMWLPKVKKGGIFCGHDCKCHADKVDPKILRIEDISQYRKSGVFPGVVRAVCERFDKEQLHINRGIWWIQK